MLTFDQQMSLVNSGLAVNKNDGKYTTFKYHRKAMYKYLWNQIPDLLECRGHVYDNETKQLVQAAPRKTFNYLEQGYWGTKPLDTKVAIYKKINGYMTCATIHDGELVVSTTGTTTSDYAKYARELLLRDYEFYDLVIEPGVSTLFEVVAPWDPHIVQEREGLHLLGVREKNTGKYWPMGNHEYCTLKEAILISNQDRGEGFMVFDGDDCCKLKTPYYTGKKKLMRMTDNNVSQMYKGNPVVLPMMWDEVPYQIMESYTEQEWLNTLQQERRVFLERLVDETQTAN